MYKKHFKYEELEVELVITKTNYEEKDGILFFGSPLFDKKHHDTFQDLLAHTKGSFFAIDIQPNEIKLAVDYFGGVRIYYGFVDKKHFFSDSYKVVLDKVKYNKISFNNDLFEYWKRMRYTLSDSTFYNEIKKIAPAEVISISNEVKTDNYYKEFTKIKSSKHLFKKAIYDDLIDTMNKVRDLKKQVFMFFSGGVDSVLLALMLQKSNIDFKAVFILYKPFIEVNYKDYLRAQRISKLLGIELEIVEADYDISKKEIKDVLINDIIDNLLFDRHSAFANYNAFKCIKAKYGDDIIIVNGQGSDSIISYGPSSLKKLSRARISLYYPYSVVNKLGCYLTRKWTGRNFRVPKNRDEYLTAFIYNHVYHMFIDRNIDYTFLKSFKEKMLKGLSDIENMRLKLKINTHIQGADNQVVVSLAHTEGLSVILPYCTIQYCEACLSYKNNFYETFKSKYVLYSLLDDLKKGIIKEIFKKDYPTDIEFHNYNHIQENIQNVYFEEIERLNSEYGVQ